MVTKNMNLKEVLDTYPDLIDTFAVNGFKGLDNEMILKQLSKLTLEQICKNKGIGVDPFLTLLNEQLEEEFTDVTLMESKEQKNNKF